MMRIGRVFLLLLFTSSLHAFDVTVSGSFTISGFTRTDNKLVLPGERNYHNIRVLDKATYDWLTSCPMPCKQEMAEVVPVVEQIRPAQTRRQMWIVQVAFNRAWLITFLVFQKGNDFNIKGPEHFVFINSELAKQTHRVILQAVRQEGNV